MDATSQATTDNAHEALATQAIMDMPRCITCEHLPLHAKSQATADNAQEAVAKPELMHHALQHHKASFHFV